MSQTHSLLLRTGFYVPTYTPCTQTPSSSPLFPNHSFVGDTPCHAATPCQILSRYREEYEAGGLGTSLVSFLTAMETESDSFDIDEVMLV